MKRLVGSLLIKQNECIKDILREHVESFFERLQSFLRDYREFLRGYREYFEKVKRDYKKRVKNFQGYLDFEQNIRKF